MASVRKCGICSQSGHDKRKCSTLTREKTIMNQQEKKIVTKEDFIKSPWNDYVIESILRCINNNDTTTLGKILAPAAELWICDELNKSGIEAEVRSSNGYDLLLRDGKRIQAKYRFSDGLTAYSKQLHFENTRRLSNKNQGEASKSGHVSYSSKEFDYVAPMIIHCKKEDMDPVKYFEALNNPHILLVPVEDLEDPNRPGFCRNSIPSTALEKNKDNIQKFVNSKENND